MPPSIAELIEALPEDRDAGDDRERSGLEGLWMRAIPVGTFKRLSMMGTLQAKIGVAYLFRWIRGWFQDAEQRQKDLAETHFRTALRLLDSMCYLRGAVMKMGQTLANFPDIVPDEIVRTLEKLHFEAPPMHFSLIREFVHNELGADPEDLFESFDEVAFAAASLGQVHRARLKTGENVAVKIQYPGIARTIRADLRILAPALLPARLSTDWEYLKQGLDHVCESLERETDYENEARLLKKARALFGEDDGIVVPRVHDEFSTRRVLTMEFLDGVHIHDFLDTDPSQDLRDRYGEKLMRSWYRLLYGGRLDYIDWHPGNFIFMDGERLGLVDFGCMIEFDDAEWELMQLADRPLTTGLREDRVAFIKRWNVISDEEKDREFLDLSERFVEWSWRGRSLDEPTDFGDGEELRRGLEIFAELFKRRYARSQPCTVLITRWEFAYRSFLYRLKARVNLTKLAEEEIGVTGWNRSEYVHR